MNPIIIVQGGQYGSEGKGQVAASLCMERQVDFAIRTGAINAGHTVYYQGKPYKMQQLPTGWVNPDTKLVIGPGAYIHPAILAQEVTMVAGALDVEESVVRDRILIDWRAGFHSLMDEIDANKANRHLSIGATGKGCAEAVISKIKDRGVNPALLFHQTGYAESYNLVDTPGCVVPALHGGAQLLIEGTQGSMLDLHLGPYPFVTSRMTSAANWVAEAGLSPAFKYEVVLVARTCPIRVAGNSGPLPNETSWPVLIRHMNFKRAAQGLDLLMPEVTLVLFEECIKAEALKLPMPRGSNGLDQHTWCDNDRKIYREALSVLNTRALQAMERTGPEDYATISKVFELTTVTKKLRRIAHLDHPGLRDVIMRERPSSIVLTFLNYIFPHLWGTTETIVDTQVRNYVYQLQNDLGGTPIDYVTTGPLPGHMVRFR